MRNLGSYYSTHVRGTFRNLGTHILSSIAIRNCQGDAAEVEGIAAPFGSADAPRAPYKQQPSLRPPQPPRAKGSLFFASPLAAAVIVGATRAAPQLLFPTASAPGR